MRSAGTFATILAVGVLIVLIYQWSGDSVIVLIMCLVTLFALLALWDRKPWQVAPDDGEWPASDRHRADRGDNRGHEAEDDDRNESGRESNDDEAAHDPVDDGPEHVRSDRSSGSDGTDPSSQADQFTMSAARPLDEDSPIWRCRFDVRLDDNGVIGLALGERETRQWPWDLLVSAGVGWSAAIAAEDQVEERVGLHLGLADQPLMGPTDLDQNGAEGVTESAQLMFGAGQHPGAVLGAIRRGIEAARVRRSRFSSLSPAERTRQLANALSPDPINLTKHIRSPELLYQDARRTLLTNRTLRRISRDASAEQILTAIEQLFTAHGATDLDETEFGPLGAAADRGDSETVYLGASRVAESRGYRLAFIHHGGDDHLLGLLAFDDADDWDGQTVGSGLTAIALAPPAYQ